MNTIRLMVGSNYDPILPDCFAELNHWYEPRSKVHEIYGSVQGIKVFGSARPDFRVPDLTTEQFKDEVKKYRERGILVNYTENTPLLNKNDLDVKAIQKALEWLVDIGVTRLTVAHPLAMEIAHEVLPIEISTIYAVKSAYQLRELKKRCFSINKLCLDVARNRDFSHIRRMKQECDELGITLELLANEFCITDCVDRAQCYLDHAQIKSDEEAAMFSRYPMGRCTRIRRDSIEWVRARFIIPQAMRWYQENLGIDHFKITGRTHPTDYIKWITQTYLDMDYHGNLLNLWADVKNIKRVAQGKTDFLPAKDFIDADQFGDEFLWKYWNDPRLQSDLDYEYEFLNQFV